MGCDFVSGNDSATPALRSTRQSSKLLKTRGWGVPDGPGCWTCSSDTLGPSHTPEHRSCADAWLPASWATSRRVRSARRERALYVQEPDLRSPTCYTILPTPTLYRPYPHPLPPLPPPSIATTPTLAAQTAGGDRPPQPRCLAAVQGRSGQLQQPADEQPACRWQEGLQLQGRPEVGSTDHSYHTGGITMRGRASVCTP
jgi:hypothetical protein